MGKKNKDHRRKELERKQDKWKDVLSKKTLAKERRKRQYNRAEDKEWQGNFDKFTVQLKAIGFEIFDVAGDGNCLFRAISDQLYGSATRHVDVRQSILDHIEKNREGFEPFIEDDEPFEKYCRSMRKPGKWGGNIELQAASVFFGVDIHIYQLGKPRWDVINPPNTKIITLSYHDGDHYNSVHALGKANGTVKLSPVMPTEKKNHKNNDNYNNNNNNNSSSKNNNDSWKYNENSYSNNNYNGADDIPNELEQSLMEEMQCYDLEIIRQILREGGNDDSDTKKTIPSEGESNNNALNIHYDIDGEPIIIPPEDGNESDKNEKEKNDENNSKKKSEEKENEQKEREREREREQHERNLLKITQRGNGKISNAQRKQMMKKEKEEERWTKKKERQVTKGEEKQKASIGVSSEVDTKDIPLEAFQTMRI